MERSLSAYLDARRLQTTSRLNALRGKLGEAEKVAKHQACVYVTGSFGRGEASSHSDLDLFIAGRTVPVPGQEQGRRALSRLDEICVKAELIDVTRKMHIQEFSGDGEYLIHYTVEQLIKTLGHQNDDASNTFTARLLLLLESKPLLGDDVYWEAIDQVIAAYWGDFADHKTDFVPAFLANDILRIWRTFCVNYEARTAREPDEKKAKRKLKNYKLKHSRLLTCYSALLYLLGVFAARKTVTPADARAMVASSPTERLDSLAQNFGSDKEIVGKLLDAYERFLTNTDASEDELVKRFMDSAISRRYFTEANEFGDLVWQLLEATGRGTRLHRLLLV
jgi:predicted nucleotidyltransferase